MMRKFWVLGLILSAGLLARAPEARADGQIVPVNWGHYGHGCANCGSGYYAPYGGYGYYAYPHSYWAGHSYGYPAGYWGGYYSAYGWGYPGYALGFPGTYGYGIGYPNGWGYGHTYYQPYAASYYAAPGVYYAPRTYYYQPTAVLSIPYTYTQPAVTNLLTTTARVSLAYPQAQAIGVAPQAAPSITPYPATVIPSQSFQYDGGPARPVPMPRLELQPAAPSGPAIYNMHLTEETNAPSSKYAYKAYGENSGTSSTSSESTVLVKGSR